MNASLRELAKQRKETASVTSLVKEDRQPTWLKRLKQREGKTVFIHPEVLKELKAVRKELNVRSKSDVVHILIWYYRHPYEHPIVWNPTRKRVPQWRHSRSAEEKAKWWMNKNKVPAHLWPLYLKAALHAWSLTRRYSGQGLKTELDILKYAWSHRGLKRKDLNQLIAYVLT